MNEFSLIDVFFKQSALKREDVIFGIGDDAACLAVPAGHQLLVSTDTLVADVHFLSQWDAFDIAWKAVMVNVSDIAAMGAAPCWISLALTLPTLDKSWLSRFAEGLHSALKKYNIALIGGDTTKGPLLSITLTIHGLAPNGQAVRRSGAKPGDSIWVSGLLGAAAQAVVFLTDETIDKKDNSLLLQRLKYPEPRVDLSALLRNYASAAIDISDGLSGDLNHLCKESQVGALLQLETIPIHPLVQKYQQENAVDFVLQGGDDYELCFTIKAHQHQAFLQALESSALNCYQIGTIKETKGLRGVTVDGKVQDIAIQSYSHF